MALGAQKSQVLMLVQRQGMALVLIGLGIGLAGALALTQLMSKLLFRVQATDPITFALVAGVLIAVSLVACLVPALRESGSDRGSALRVSYYSPITGSYASSGRGRRLGLRMRMRAQVFQRKIESSLAGGRSAIALS
jgi:hypothetical protein